MELRQLKYFKEACEWQNFSEAARVLHISQSTLSQQIKQLEDELDAVQKKLDEETALNDQLLQATQDEQSDAKQELRDKEQELDHTRLAYEALLTAMNCDTHEGNVTFSRAMETVARYQECLSENALAEFEKLQEQ